MSPEELRKLKLMAEEWWAGMAKKRPSRPSPEELRKLLGPDPECFAYDELPEKIGMTGRDDTT